MRDGWVCYGIACPVGRSGWGRMPNGQFAALVIRIMERFQSVSRIFPAPGCPHRTFDWVEYTLASSSPGFVEALKPIGRSFGYCGRALRVGVCLVAHLPWAARFQLVSVFRT